MALRRTVLGAITITICLLTVPCLGFGADASRIELKDGTVFENVTYKVDNEYKTIEIQEGEAKRRVSFNDIAAIVDARGQDITADILGKYYRPPGTVEKPIVQPDPAAPPPGGKKYPYSFAFHVQPNASIPVGDFYQDFKGGIAYGGDVSFPVSRQIALRGTVSKSGIGPDFELPSGISFSAWRYLFGVQYYNWPDWRTGGKTMYYLNSGFGAISHSLSAGNVSSDITKFMTALGFGLIHQVSESIGMEIGGELDVIFVGVADTKYEYYGTVQYAWILDFKVGLVVLL